MHRKHFRKREALLAYLRSTHEHPSAEMVFSQLRQDFPDISLGTVYRNLSMFKDSGEIASVGTVGGVERFDGNPAPHVHFVCNSCRSVTDLHEITVPEEVRRQAARLTGGNIEQCQVTFFGQCGICAKGETA